MTQPASTGFLAPPTTNGRLLAWVDEVASLTTPDAVHWCDGSEDEYHRLAAGLVDAGTFQRLSDEQRPNSYLALSDPDDGWKRQLPQMHEHYATFGSKLPVELHALLNTLDENLHER